MGRNGAWKLPNRNANAGASGIFNGPGRRCTGTGDCDDLADKARSGGTGIPHAEFDEPQRRELVLGAHPHHAADPGRMSKEVYSSITLDGVDRILSSASPGATRGRLAAPARLRRQRHGVEILQAGQVTAVSTLAACALVRGAAVWSGIE